MTYKHGHKFIPPAPIECAINEVSVGGAHAHLRFRWSLIPNHILARL